MPLYNDGMLLQVLEIFYPDANNESKQEKICALYDDLENNDKKELNLSDVAEVMIYTQQIAEVVYDTIQSYYGNEKCDFLENVADNNLPKLGNIAKIRQIFFELKSKINALVVNTPAEKANSEIERLKNKEALKVKSDIYECILHPIKEELSRSNYSDRHWIKNDPSKQEKVAFASKKAGTKLKDVKPFTCRAIISPDTKFLNPVQAEFPIEEIPGLLNCTVAQQWPVTNLCAAVG